MVKKKKRKNSKQNSSLYVKYNGVYPNLCSGRLQIIQNGKKIYDKDNCLLPIDGVFRMRLKWEDAGQYSKEIQKAVKKRLSHFRYHCGGCQ